VNIEYPFLSSFFPLEDSFKNRPFFWDRSQVYD